MIEIDLEHTDEVIKFLSQTNPNVISGAVRKGIGKAEAQGVKEVRKSLRGTGLKNVNKAVRYKDSLLQGIRKTKIKQDNEYQWYGLVMASSNRKSGSGSFRLPIIENSKEQERYRKTYKSSPGKGRTGVFKARPFFSQGIDKVDVGSHIEKAIIDALQKINN